MSIINRERDGVCLEAAAGIGDDALLICGWADKGYAKERASSCHRSRARNTHTKREILRQNKRLYHYLHMKSISIDRVASVH